MMVSCIGLSAVNLARRIRRGELSPIDVIEDHIAQISALNPRINAVIHPLFTAARGEAVHAAVVLRRGEPVGPLHGVPITIKDAFDVADVPATCGLVSRRDHVPTHDAVAVARLRAAGAIVLGKTNTPDNCWHQETVSQLFGRTNNPWDVRRSVGGSTGGEAAIIAAGGSAIGLGSDIAGSIRLPAAFCGIVGLRPTSGSLDETGFWPPSDGRLADLNAIGPMARRVEDVALAYAVLAGLEPSVSDTATLGGRRVCFWYDDGFTPSSAAIQIGIRAAVDALVGAGMHASAGAPVGRRFATVGWVAYQQATERAAIAAGFGGGTVWSPLREAGRAFVGQPRVQPQVIRSWLTTYCGSRLAALWGIDGTRWRTRLRAEFLDLVAGEGVAVCPVFPTTAPRHGWSVATPLTASYQTWVNLAGLPALVVPVGRTRRGMPIGVQIVGAPGAEQTILAAGMAIQQALMPQWSGPLLGAPVSHADVPV